MVLVLASTRASLMRIDECLTKLREIAGSTSTSADEKLLSQFSGLLDEDLNIAGAWGAIFDWVRDTNRRLAENSLDSASAASTLATWTRLDSTP